VTREPSKTTDLTQAKAEFQEELAAKGIRGILAESDLLKISRSVGCCDVYSHRLPCGVACLIKTYLDRPLWVRRLFGRRSLKNEFKRLVDFERFGIRVPKPYALLDADTLVEEFLENVVRLRDTRDYDDTTRPGREFFVELISMVRKMHASGLVHGDLRRANIMIQADGNPCMVDVATSIHLKERSWWGKRMLFNAFRNSDLFSLARIVMSFYPDLIDDDLNRAIEQAPWYLRLGRFFRQEIYRPLRGKRRKPERKSC